VAALGPDYITVHTAIDEQMRGASPFETLRQIAESVEVPVGVAGGINSETCVAAVQSGASIVIVGGAITKSADARAAVAEIRRAVDEGRPVESRLYRRVGESGLREAFLTVSTANVSDAMHRERGLEGLRAIVPGARMAGPAFTVRTAPGDWAKPVSAIDEAAEGDVLVVDAGGVPPAVWGELATNSALVRKLGGVVIWGAVRDTGDIRTMGLPVFASAVSSAAGEPKGFGETGVGLQIAGRHIAPGDWIVGDDDGVMVVPRAGAAEVANRAMDVLERENRFRAEIKAGSTLSYVTELLRWEKKR
jgi:3-hexulose-6-phosphate synthase/6-phospho-3-hexuloisomerase